ncbi:MAG TPA: alpha/beta hydrolase [Gaiellaceae bacterium]|nr:alpha/beta hydrolase [Gaiellaceae bacterium]
MALDPQAQAFLDRLKELGVPGLGELSPEEHRATGDAAAAAVFGPVPDVPWDDRTIPGPAGPIPVRVYRPVGEPAPVLLYFHGGGWVLGSLETVHGVCATLAKLSGCVVCSVDYRLAPEHRFPAALDDAWAVTTWAAEHADELGGLPGGLAVGGDSAGGNLAAVCALRARDAGLPLALQLLVYPVCDGDLDTSTYRAFAEGYYLTRYSMEWFWGHYVPDADRFDPDASPLRAEDVSGTAPALVITAGFDPLRDEGEAYAKRLEEAGVPVTVSCYEGMFHGFFRMPGEIDRANDALAEAAGALRDAFAARPAA